MSLVEVVCVTKQYASGEETIIPLNEVDLRIEKGEFVSLMGSSGCGKSTLSASAQLDGMPGRAAR